MTVLMCVKCGSSVGFCVSFGCTEPLRGQVNYKANHMVVITLDNEMLQPYTSGHCLYCWK